MVQSIRLLVPAGAQGEEESVINDVARRFKRSFGATVEYTALPNDADLFNTILADVVRSGLWHFGTPSPFEACRF